MIGTILIAVIGYGLAAFLAGIAVVCVAKGISGSWRGASQPIPNAIGNAALAVLVAAFTRWLIGGAF